MPFRSRAVEAQVPRSRAACRLSIPFLVALCVVPPTASFADPRLVRNINTQAIGGSEPDGFTTIGNRVVFAATDEDHGRELWTSDGDAPPELVTDLCSGACSGVGDPVFGLGQLLFFQRGGSIYRSDGTAEGTFQLAEVYLDVHRGEADWRYLPAVGRWIFRGRAVTGVGSLWVTDGTPDGTRPLVEAPFPTDPPALQTLPGQFFYLIRGTTERTLWVTDGTAEGTFPVKTSAGIDSLAVVGDELLFVVRVDNLDLDRQLWATDGTLSGTRLVFAPTADGPGFAANLVGAGDIGFFAAYGPYGSGGQLWRTDGTAEGTFPITAFSPGFDTDQEACRSPDTGFLLGANEVVDGILYRPLDDGESGCELWRSDGSVAGTWRVADVCPGPCGSYPTDNGSGLRAIDGTAIFAAKGPKGREWWSSGPGRDDALLVVDLCEGSCDGARWIAGATDGFVVLAAVSDEDGFERYSWRGAGSELVRLTDVEPPHVPSIEKSIEGTVVDGVFVFAFNDGVDGQEPWRTDGTPAGTRVLSDLAVDLDADSGPRGSTSVSGRLVFFADDGIHGLRPYTSDGSDAGTVPLRASSPPDGTHLHAETLHTGDRLYYVLDGLWQTDGTRAGTRRLSSVSPTFAGLAQAAAVGPTLFWIDEGALWTSDGTTAGRRRYSPEGVAVRSSPQGFGHAGTGGAVANGTVVFWGDGPGGTGLWATDGTAEGTSLLAASTAGSAPVSFAPLGDSLAFAFDDGPSGSEPWITDGTVAHTYRLADFAAGLPGSFPSKLTPLGDRLYFTVAVDSSMRHLAVTDGTVAGTAIVAPLQHGNTIALEAVGDLLFMVMHVNSSYSLWRSDGTAEGTFAVLPAIDLEHGAPVFGAGDRLYFIEQRPEGSMLWSSDGTVDGTVPVHGVTEPTDTVGYPNRPARVGQLVVFSSRSASGAQELWATDGRSGVTRRVARLVGLTDSLTWLTAADHHVYFSAETPEHGRELWAITLEDLEPQVLHLGPGARFEAEVEWKDYEGKTGRATAAPLRTGDSGLFWFFHDENWEMLVKVIDACSYDGRFWVFSAAATTVEYTLRVTDTATGAVRTYENPLGRLAPSIIDTGAFDTCDEGDIETTAVVEGLSEAAIATTGDGCPAGALCLGHGRFRASITWRDHAGRTGSGEPVPGSDDSGLFWFFADENWEALVKVVDGCTWNGHHWVFAAATTDVAFTLRVEDTTTGAVAEYHNGLGIPAQAIADTTAFPTCP